MTHRAQERLFEPGPYLQQGSIPLPSRVDPGESAIVQLIADVEGELQVKRVRICFAHRNIDRPEVQRRTTAV